MVVPILYVKLCEVLGLAESFQEFSYEWEWVLRFYHDLVEALVVDTEM
jgi:hypothetical protein